MKFIGITSILLTILNTIFTFSQTIINQQFVTSTAVAIGSSPNDPNSYIWSEVSNTKQGVQINVVPPEKTAIYLQQNNAWINFNSFNYGLMTSLEVKYDDGNWQTIFSSTASESGWISCPFSDLGHHSISVKWSDIAGTLYSREYDVYMIPQCNKFYKDGYGNSLTLWDGGNSSKVILISEGFDAYNTTYPEYLMFKGEDLFYPLIQDGYKIYFLNYIFNSQDMRNSAGIFNSATKYISQVNSNSSITGAGVSMGGVIVRYALTKAEQDGSPLPVNKFISIDAPQQGAVLSKPLQDYLKGHTTGTFQQHGLNNIAARQMLKYSTFGSLQNGFYNELENLNNGIGYPIIPENIGVAFSNGYPNPSTGNWLEIVFRGNLLPTPIVITNPEYFSLTSDEKVAGSYLPNSLLATGPSPTNIYDLKYWGIIPSGLVWSRRYSYSNPTFIPYNSALDLVNGVSKFDKEIQANANYFHDEFPPEVIPLILKELIDPFSITLKHQFEFDNSDEETYEAYHSLPLALSVPNTKTKNGKTYQFIIWNDGNSSTSRTIIPTGDRTYTALYKVINKSNESTAYSNNGQRKLIETLSGSTTWLHKVYSSMGHVWIEHRSNNGQTWVLGNNGQPLDGSAGGKNPSIAYTKGNIGYNYIGVVWQQKDGSYYKIMGKMFNQSTSSSSTPSSVSTIRTLHTEPADLYSSVNANPNLVLASGNFGAYFVTFERKSTSGGYLPGINWVVGKIEDIGHAYAGPFGYVEDNGLVNGTNA